MTHDGNEQHGPTETAVSAGKEVFAVRIKICSVCVLLLMAGLCLSAWGAPQAEVRHISVVNLPLKGAPDGLSTTIAMLKYGDPVTVLSAVFADAGAPVQNPGTKADKSKKSKQPKSVESPRWLRVTTAKGEGYVPEGGTVTAGQFEKQMSGNQRVGNTSAAGKGFSESEDPDLTAVKGAGGSAQAGNADFAQLDKLVADKPVEDQQEKNRDFRQTGKLGEFKHTEMHP